MISLRDTIKHGLDISQSRNKKMTAYGIAKIYGTSYPNLKDAIDGGRGFSDEMLTALGNCPEFPYSFNELKGIQFVEEYGEEAIYEAMKALKPEWTERLVREVWEESKKGK